MLSIFEKIGAAFSTLALSPTLTLDELRACRSSHAAKSNGSHAHQSNFRATSEQPRGSLLRLRASPTKSNAKATNKSTSNISSFEPRADTWSSVRMFQAPGRRHGAAESRQREASSGTQNMRSSWATHGTSSSAAKCGGGGGGGGRAGRGGGGGQKRALQRQTRLPPAHPKARQLRKHHALLDVPPLRKAKQPGDI